MLNNLLSKVGTRTMIIIIIILIGITLLAIIFMGYQVFIREDSQDIAISFATTTSLPTLLPTETRQPLPVSITPDLEPALVTPTPDLANEISEETALPNIGVHPTFLPTDQPCENCHQDLRNSN